ncbi:MULTISPECIES: hypothetical protein [Bradyrhizobium]|nr:MULTISPECIES: hypothetical protein [Bradyrhizobium]MCS3759484.1 hypothetical protein [Bradyrhizobium centrosematis]MCS3772626.1 hypothetical protein [Bradyrhizobium centrosematis]MDT4741089.1 hypothetical protein [Bradyrhizobium sp. WYCCWR 12699]
MDFYATAIFDIAVELFFRIRRSLTRKPAVAGRPSVPVVPPR